MHLVESPASLIGLGELPLFAGGWAVADQLSLHQLHQDIFDDEEDAFEYRIGVELHPNDAPNWLFLDGHAATLAQSSVIALGEGLVNEDEPFSQMNWIVNKLHPDVAR